MTWIVNGGITEPVTIEPTVTTPPNNTRSQPASDGESEVEASDKELLSPCQLVSKVRQLDQVEHTFDKGAWAVMPSLCQGWKIYVCDKLVHCTTQSEVRIWRGFGQWLQLIHCANLLSCIQVFL